MKPFTRSKSRDTLYIATWLAFTGPVVSAEEGRLAHAEDVIGQSVGVGHVFAWLSDAVDDITARETKTNEHDLTIVGHRGTGITSLLWKRSGFDLTAP